MGLVYQSTEQRKRGLVCKRIVNGEELNVYNLSEWGEVKGTKEEKDKEGYIAKRKSEWEVTWCTYEVRWEGV